MGSAVTKNDFLFLHNRLIKKVKMMMNDDDAKLEFLFQTCIKALAKRKDIRDKEIIALPGDKTKYWLQTTVCVIF